HNTPTLCSGCRQIARDAIGRFRPRNARFSAISMDFRGRRRMGGWWTGLDSNQRTLARADLQSAAFNHSATCPHAWRAGKRHPFEEAPSAERRPFGEAALACQWGRWHGPDRAADTEFRLAKG